MIILSAFTFEIPFRLILLDVIQISIVFLVPLLEQSVITTWVARNCSLQKQNSIRFGHLNLTFSSVSHTG